MALYSSSVEWANFVWANFDKLLFNLCTCPFTNFDTKTTFLKQCLHIFKDNCEKFVIHFAEIKKLAIKKNNLAAVRHFYDTKS